AGAVPAALGEFPAPCRGGRAVRADARRGGEGGAARRSCLQERRRTPLDRRARAEALAMARQPLRLGVAYDFRNPPESGLSHQALYAAIMDQVAWLDGLGLDLVWFTEHHFVDDG